MLLGSIEKDVRDMNRFRQIVEVLFKHELGFLLEAIHLKKLLPMHKRLQHEMFLKKHTQPEQLRTILEELGGAFPKLGQLLSLRPDLIPPAYCDELRKLQDDVLPIPFKEVEAVLRKELKKPLKKIFRKIDPEPVASASIAQVHKAILVDGSLVAMKIQRPKIRKQIILDIEILEVIAKHIKKHLHQDLFDPNAIVEEFKRYTENELDFVKEGKNIDLFYENAKHQEHIRIPKVFWEQSTDNLLVMEFIKGGKLLSWKKKGPGEREAIANTYVNAILHQVFHDGFFHGDPHPGNVLVTSKQRIAFLDFGIVGHFDEEAKEELLNLFISLMTGDLQQMVDAMIDLNLVNVNVNEQKLKDDLFMELSKYYNVSLEKVQLSHLITEVMELARKDHVSVPANFVLLLKTVMTTESVAQELYPSFNILDVGRPFLLELAADQRRPTKLIKHWTRSFNQVREFIQKVPKQSQELLRGIKKGDELVSAIDTDVRLLTKEMDRSSNRISLGLLITALFISSAFIMRLPQPTVSGYPIVSMIGFGFGIFFVILLIISIMREH